MTDRAYHEPVLLDAVLEALKPRPGTLMLDGTLGAGGHTAALLDAGARVIGFDQDPEAIAFAQKRFAGMQKQFTAVRGNFVEVGATLDRLGVAEIDGALLDLGASSRHFDAPERGFSFMHDGPLDMRMDPSSPITAASLVNTMSGEQLERIFRSLGEEPAARRVAARLTRDRLVRPFATTLELAEAIEGVIRRARPHSSRDAKSFRPFGWQ